MTAEIVSGRCRSESMGVGSSIVDERIRCKDFPYLHPYFYNHPFALRCELGIGDTNEEYMASAVRRALEIYNTLFPAGADAIVFNYWSYDYCDSGDAEVDCYGEEYDLEGVIENRIEIEAKKLRFLSEYQMKYRHFTVRNIQTYDEPEDEDYERQRRNRVVCYSDGKGFDYHALLKQEIQGKGLEVGFVSFENECIFSVYDDRGCDVVFMTQEKLREYYHRLQPYFLEYDALEMEKRYNG